MNDLFIVYMDSIYQWLDTCVIWFAYIIYILLASLFKWKIQLLFIFMF